MIRKTYSALALLAVTGMVLVGCGKEDLTELDTNWGKKETDVVAKLEELKTKRNELVAKFETVKAANVADTAKAADRTMVETMLNNQGTAVGEIETTINDLKAKREEAMKTGKKAEYEAAWKDAEAKYEAALTRINELESQNNDLSGKINGLSAPVGTTDTAAVNGAGATTDTATAAANSKSGSGAATTAGTTASGSTTTGTPDSKSGAAAEKSTDAKANDDKPAIEKNKNP